MRDGGVECVFCGEVEESAFVVGSLRLRMPRWRKGDMVVVVVRGHGGGKGGERGVGKMYCALSLCVVAKCW